ncbi:5-formyltetrahydrofolate cyclo-ligase [Deinococcus aquiradiocola]|uniref:5-formyltetrahydrofolate cyclo-ligase n=1 Tax=Deinococcus aquiradiocola TaxID=393059 RepID=UPI00166D21DC|nr:5-formyltetrahydrofolate cyclo-ligase [Deinococcus aquiradiocola]
MTSPLPSPEFGPPAPDAPKSVWRAWARAVRAALPEPDHAGVCAELLAWLRARGARRVLAYHALPGEPDVSGLAGHVQLFTTRAVFRPSARLTLHDWHAATEVSRFGALQPPRGTPEVPRGEVDVVLLPGLAFDRRGWRLGYGGGFYDRLLEVWDVPTVGVTPAALWVPHVPHEAHDLPVRFVATEDGVREIRPD